MTLLSPEPSGETPFPPRRGDLPLLACAGALLSLLITGFVFGIGNNMFHLAIASSLYDEPQFAHDPFIQSLHYFASGIWLLLKGSARFFDPYWVFLAGDYLSRILTFAGFLSCAELLGVTTRKQRVLFSLILACTGLLQGESYAGGGGLFINCFTHSEIANGISLLALSFMLRNRIVAAHAVNGVAFFVNAFMAVWNFAPLCLIALSLYRNKTMGLRPLLARTASGLAIFALIASPVVLNILSNPEFGRKPSFDYVEFLTNYWPYHTLFAETSLKQKIAAALVLSLGFISFHALGARGRPFMLALTGYSIVYAAGILAPYVTHSPAILNLHLLRVSTFFHLLAALGAGALAVKWCGKEDRYYRLLLAPLLIVLLCSQRLTLLAPFFILLCSLPALLRYAPASLLRHSGAFAALMAGVFCLLQFSLIRANYAANRELTGQVAEFTSLGHWARDHTPPDSVFLMMTHDPRPWAAPQAREAAHDLGSAVFPYASHRQIWVDFKSGAAALWQPSYYLLWHPRIAEVLALTSLPEKMAYARRNAVSYVVDACDSASPYPAVYKAQIMCLYSALPGAPAEPK